MAELSLTCPAPAASGVAAGGAIVDIDKRVLVRTGGCVERDTTIDIIDPGPGWTTSGDEVTFANATEFNTQAMVFENGVLMFTAENAAADNDVYFVAPSGEIAFETALDENDVIQIWKFGATSSG